MKLGDSIRHVREERHMKLKEVAAATGLSISYISEIERGRTLPTLDTLAKIAHALAHDLTIGFVEPGDIRFPCSELEVEMIVAVRERNYEKALMFMLVSTGAPDRLAAEAGLQLPHQEGIWLDEPDGEGWWWRRRENVKEAWAMYVLAHPGSVGLFTHHEGYTVPCAGPNRMLTGTWQRIAPPITNSSEQPNDTAK